MSTTTPDQVRDQLRSVIDPEIGINIVDLGLIYEVDVVLYVPGEGEPAAADGDERATVTMTLTTPGCPAGPYILQQVKQEAESLDHVRKAEIDLTFNPMWNEEMMSEDVRWILGR